MSASRKTLITFKGRIWSAALGASLLGIGQAQALLIVPTYNANVPAAAQTVFNSIANSYSLFNNTNTTVNVAVQFGVTGLAASSTNIIQLSYTNWRADMAADSA